MEIIQVDSHYICCMKVLQNNSSAFFRSWIGLINNMMMYIHICNTLTNKILKKTDLQCKFVLSLDLQSIFFFRFHLYQYYHRSL